VLLYDRHQNNTYIIISKHRKSRGKSMSQQQQIAKTTGIDVKKCPREIVLKLKRVALEKDISYQEICLEAFKEYLASMLDRESWAPGNTVN
jgi:hypothetical protein